MVEVCRVELQSKKASKNSSTCLAKVKISLLQAHFPKPLTKAKQDFRPLC